MLLAPTAFPWLPCLVFVVEEVVELPLGLAALRICYVSCVRFYHAIVLDERYFYYSIKIISCKS